MVDKQSENNKELVEALLSELGSPITNLKKLLEIYQELLSRIQSKPGEAVKERLRIWRENTNLRKISASLLN